MLRLPARPGPGLSTCPAAGPEEVLDTVVTLQPHVSLMSSEQLLFLSKDLWFSVPEGREAASLSRCRGPSGRAASFLTEVMAHRWWVRPARPPARAQRSHFQAPLGGM